MATVIQYKCNIFNDSKELSDEYRKSLDDYVGKNPVYIYSYTARAAGVKKVLVLPRAANVLSKCNNTVSSSDTNGVSVECEPRASNETIYDCRSSDDKKPVLSNCELTNEIDFISFLPRPLLAKRQQWCKKADSSTEWICSPGTDDGVLEDVLFLFDQCQEITDFSGEDRDTYQFKCHTFAGSVLAGTACINVNISRKDEDSPTSTGQSSPTLDPTYSDSDPPSNSNSNSPISENLGSGGGSGGSSGSGGSKAGAIAAGVMGGMLVISLIALGIMWLRRRKDQEALKTATKYIQSLNNPNPGGEGHQIHPTPSPPPLAGAYSYAPGSTGKYTDATVTSAVDNPTIPDATSGAILLNTMTVNAIDDKYAARTFDLITQEIKDFIGNYFDPRYYPSTTATGTTIGSPSFPKEIRDIWKEISPWMLPSGEDGVFPPSSSSTSGAAAATAINSRVRMLVLRATVWALIQHIWRSGELIGRPGINIYTDDSDSRSSTSRQEAFSRQIAHPGYKDHQASVTQSLMLWIDGILLALANYTAASPHTSNPGAATQAERHVALAVIIDRAASLYGKLHMQVADFKLVGGTSGENGGHVWDGAVMEDIDGLVVGGGVQQNTKVRIIVAPGLVKWGNSRGENRQQRLVLVREKVLLGDPRMALDGGRR